MSALGKLLKELRGKRSLREIGRLSGVSHVQLSNIEKGFDRRTGNKCDPKIETLLKLAKIYGMPIQDFIDVSVYGKRKNGSDLTQRVLNSVELERYVQNKKWGVQRHPHGTWLAILGEEFGEVCEAMQKGMVSEKPTDSDNLYEELIQVAAVAVAIAEQVLEQSQ